MADDCQVALKSRLFGAEGRVLINFKMLRGDVASTSKEELCEQLHSGMTQRLTGISESHSEFPEDGSPECIDLNSLI